jgi:hypothetical protein
VNHILLPTVKVIAISYTDGRIKKIMVGFFFLPTYLMLIHII